MGRQGLGFRKLPKDPRVVDRLYWLDGLDQKAIAQMYDVLPPAVSDYMKRHGIRARSRWRRTGDCIVCGEPVCQRKYWKNGKPRWVFTNRCQQHFIEEMRKHWRAYNHRKRGPLKQAHKHKETFERISVTR